MDAILDITSEYVMGMAKMERRPHILLSLDSHNWLESLYKIQSLPQINNLLAMKNINKSSNKLFNNATKNSTIQTLMSI
jgi:hypothetical protein